MAKNPDNLEYYVTFPNPNFKYQQNHGESDYVFVINEEKLPVIVLFGWAGCKDKYLAKYSQIYEERGLITLRYTAPVKWLFMNTRTQIGAIGDKLVKLLFELNFENHPIVVHCFSNGGAFLYQNFSYALDKRDRSIELKGVIFDSAPGRRRVRSLYRALTAIFQGNMLYNISVSFLLTVFLSVMWLYEVVSNQFFSRPNVHSNNPFENLKKEKNRCPQLFIYSKNDDLIPHTDIEYFANFRKTLGVDVTTVCYENSLHVKHLPENRQSYVSSVFQFINRCLNGIN